MKNYKAPLFSRYSHFVIGLLALGICLSILADAVLGSEFTLEDIWPLLFSIVFLPVTVAISNKYPNLKTDELHLWVQFYVWYIKVPWEHVEGLRQVKDEIPECLYVIEVKGVPFFFNLLGLIYKGDWSSCVLVNCQTDNLDELIKEIKAKTKRN